MLIATTVRVTAVAISFPGGSGVLRAMFKVATSLALLASRAERTIHLAKSW